MTSFQADLPKNAQTQVQQDSGRQHASATARNRQPILEVLRKILPQESEEAHTVLEIASGTGEHAIYFASQLRHLYWLPSEPQAEGRVSIQAWAEAESTQNLLLPPLNLNVSQQPWPNELSEVSDRLNHLNAPIAAIVNINMIHISPWQACQHLMAGAQRTLPYGGVLYLYGPFKRDGEHTAPSNEAFDRLLRSRDSRWGIRDLQDVIAVAEQQELELSEVIEMPANNLSVVFRRLSDC